LGAGEECTAKPHKKRKPTRFPPEKSALFLVFLTSNREAKTRHQGLEHVGFQSREILFLGRIA